MRNNKIENILSELLKLPNETEWVEFKKNNADPVEIGEYISAISNSSALLGKEVGYIVWGVDNSTQDLLGTNFKPRKKKVSNEELENWLATQLRPDVNFKIHEFESDGKSVVIFEIPSAKRTPVRFKETEFIRVGSYKKKLKDFTEKERELWAVLSSTVFEKDIAEKSVSTDVVLSLIDYPAYFELTKQGLPDNRDGILKRLEQEKFIINRGNGVYDITNFGAILFAKDLSQFSGLSRKAIRVVIYNGINRVEAKREKEGQKGYAIGFNGAISFINDQLSQNEEIEQALRKEVKIYPDIAIRELVANTIIHQDFSVSGSGPIVEIFDDRVEITNPGVPLIDTLRFIDEPPQSRNELLAAFMRRINICEERGSGIDKVIFYVEAFQLPAPDFSVTSNHTKAVLFAHRDFSDMSKEDRVRASYQHACLCYVSNKQMTNASLRERFSISEKNYSMASRVIADTIEASLIKQYDPENRSKKHAKYVPFWF